MTSVDTRTLYRVGLMAGAHENDVETLSVSDHRTPDHELQAGIAHFLLGAAYTTRRVLHSLFPNEGSADDVSCTATFVGVEMRRLFPLPGSGGRGAPCVVALFASEKMATMRSRIRETFLVSEGVCLRELFEGGNTYPEGHVYVLLNVCACEEDAVGLMEAYASDPRLRSTAQETSSWLTAISPCGACYGL